jgi:hypothetical protein
METSIAEVESPQETTEETSIENASTEDLINALGITPETAEPATEEPQPEATSPEPEVESQEPEESESEEEKLAKRRIRPRNELDQQVIDLYRSEGFSGSFADASRVIYGQDVQPSFQPTYQPQEQVEASEPDPIQGIDKQAEDIRSTIIELEGKVEKAAEELETTEALKLQRDIMKKELELQNLTSRKERMEEAQSQQVYQTHRSKAMESRDRVYERFPALQDKASVYRKQFDDYVSQAQSDPDYAAVFDSPKWPELLANEFASVSPAPAVAQQPQAVAPQPQAPQMGTQAKVLTTGTTAQPVSAPMTADGLLQQLPNIGKEDIYAMLGAPGGVQPLR